MLITLTKEENAFISTYLLSSKKKKIETHVFKKIKIIQPTVLNLILYSPLIKAEENEL